MRILTPVLLCKFQKSFLRNMSLSAITTAATQAVDENNKILQTSKPNIIQLNSSYTNNVAELLTTCFPTSDAYSWGRPLGFTDEGFRGYMDSYIPEYFTKENHTILGVIDAQNTTNAIGVLLYTDFEPIELDREKNEFNKSAPIDALMGTIRLTFIDALSSKNPDLSREAAAQLKCGYVAWMGVHPDHRRRRIVSALIEEVTEQMRQKNFSYAIAYATSPKSRDAFLKVGYELWGEVTYRTFEAEGGWCPFETLPDAVSIVVKKLEV